MQHRPFHVQDLFFITLIAIVGIISFFVFRPYLYAVLLALVIAIAVEPVYNHLVRVFKKHNGVASLLSVILVVVIIAIPVGFFGWQLLHGVEALYSSLANQPEPALTQSIQNVLPDFLTHINPHLAQSLETYIQQSLSFFIQNIGSVFSGVVSVLGDTLVALFSLFFILKNKTRLVALIKRISPIPAPHDDLVIRRVQESINSVLRGSLTIAVLEGITYSIGFTLFGLPNAMVWGGLVALAALVPTLGASLVSIPSVIYLLATGNTLGGIGLLAWAVISIIFIDNMLAPVLINRGLKLHPIITLLAILGGVAFFGPLGFILGPVVIALFVTLLETYAQLHKQEPFI
ncbi:MAG: AI-2E family transporter [Patescibacteria group bacterium]|nr:AI-2E family transporter [Patescibacteria group bacterium]